MDPKSVQAMNDSQATKDGENTDHNTTTIIGKILVIPILISTRQSFIFQNEISSARSSP